MSDNSVDRAIALERLGCEVHRVSDRQIIGNSLLTKLVYKGYGYVVQAVVDARCRMLGLYNSNYDCVFLNQSVYLGPRIIQKWKKRGVTVINYINDDPFGNHSSKKWRLLLEGIPYLDAVIVVREENIREAKQFGAKRVIKVMMPAEETRHRSLPYCPNDELKWSSDVTFVGTWFPERGPFLASLIQSGLDVSIYGNNWEKAPEWPVIKPHFRSPMILGDDYVKAIQYSKINIGLLSKHNRDQYTIRSFEIPAIGALLCGERTEVHCQLYREVLAQA